MSNFITGYNPDVLSCLANLSNDEVFTPPEVANAMLDMLPQELFSDPNTKFLDPACKSGVFLREIAKRLIDGLADQIPDLQERLDHIFHEQLYGSFFMQVSKLDLQSVSMAIDDCLDVTEWGYEKSKEYQKIGDFIQSLEYHPTIHVFVFHLSKYYKY